MFLKIRMVKLYTLQYKYKLVNALMQYTRCVFGCLAPRRCSKNCTFKDDGLDPLQLEPHLPFTIYYSKSTPHINGKQKIH